MIAVNSSPRLHVSFGGTAGLLSAWLEAVWPKLRWCFLLVAILHQGVREFLFTDLAIDKAAQIAAARSLLEGRGLEYERADPNDLSQAIFIPLYQWPAGYSILLAPLLWVTNDNWWSALILDWAGVAIFFMSWFVILERLTDILGAWGKLLIWFLWASALPPIQDTSMGLLALAMYSAALAVCLRMISNRKHLLGWSILSGLFLAGAAALRYAYWPLVLVPPLGIALCAARCDRSLWRDALVNFLVGVSLLGFVAWFQKTSTGHTTFLAVYWPEEQRGWWWSNLLQFCPFPVYSLLPDEALRRIAMRFSLSETWTLQGCWIVSAIILAAFLSALWLERHSKKPATLFFFGCGGLTFLLTVGMLAYLAVRCVPAGGNWAFVEESRYYAPLFGFLLIFLTTVLVKGASSKTSLLATTLAVLSGLLLFITAWTAQYEIHDLRWVLRHYSPGLLSRYGPDAAVLMPALEHQSGNQIVFLQDESVPSHGWLALAHMANSRCGIVHQGMEPRTTRAVTILAAVPKNSPTSPWAEFCRRHEAKKIGELHDYSDCDLLRFTLEP